MSTTSLLRQSLMAQEKKEKQDSTTSMLRRSLEVNAGVAPGTFSPTNTAVPETPQRIYKPGAKAYAPINLRSLAESTIAPASSQEQTAPKYVSPFAKNEDYKELSRYKSTKNSEEIDNRNFLDKAIDWIIGAKDNEESKKYNSVTGYTTKDYDDELYEYINKNPDVVSRVNTNEATSGQYFSGVDQSFLQEMDDAEIADYNYLYATQGKDKANEFLQNLKKDLTKRQMDKYVAENQQYARENPVAASAWSVLAKPLEGVSLAGQLMDYKLDRDMDPNAGYNRFVKQNQTIRSTVPENWSKVGQFLYGTGMSIVDNLYNMALTGAFKDIGGLGKTANSLIMGIMGSSAAAESTLNALENGYSADRAMIQGALAGGIEALTERYSLERLLSPDAFKDGTLKFIHKNMGAEASEEGASTLANWTVDYLGDLITDENKSDVMEAFETYKEDKQAGKKKIWSMIGELLQDAAGGAISGGILAGVGSAANTIGNINLGSAINNTASQADLSDFVRGSYEENLQNPDASKYQNQLTQRALEQLNNKGKVSNRTLGELAQNNMYMAEEQANTVNLLNEASQRINQGKQITSSQMREILDNKQAVRTLRDNYGLRLNDNMSYSDRYNAVQDALTNRLNQNDAQVKLGFRADMVAKFAKTLGRQGERTLNAMARANGYEDVEAFSKGYTQIYNAVKADPEVKLNDLSVKADYSFTPQQLNTIYKSAVKDYEADLKKTGLSYEGETNAEETATGSQDSGTDGVGTVSLDTEVSTGSVAGRTAEVESRRKAADVRIESIRNNAALNSIAEVTSAEAGIPGGVNTDQAKTVRVLSESQWSALDTDTYNFLHELKDMGYEVKAWTGTALAYDEMSGKNAAVRGFIQGNTIGVRVDANLSARKIAYHEMFHDMVKTDSSLQADMVKKINEHYGEGKLETIVRDYVSQYGWTKASSEEILNEIFADAYAGIDIYEDLEMNYEGATQVSADVRGFLSENGVKTRNGNNAGQFSRDSEGNDISPGQAEYFKDSKIRDEDGNLQIAYHGTDADFTVFDRTKGRSNMDIQGSFFSPWELDASGYGSNVKPYYLNIKNPAPESVAYRALNRFKGQNNAGVKAREYLERLGYDGVNNGNEEYIAFHPEQIKEVENVSPTSNPDVRYSTEAALEQHGIELVDGTATKYSLDTWNETDKDRVLDALVKAGFGRSEASKWIDDVNSIAAIILGDRYRLDYDAADNQVMLKNNEEYVKTLDSSTLCAKRLLYQGTFNRITELLPDSILTPDDLIHIRKVMAEMGDTVPCGICYVESRRKTLSTFAGRWLNEVYKGKTKVTMNDLTSTVGLEKLRSEHPDIYNDYTSWMRRRGTANPKIVELRTSYRNDISKLTKGQIAKIIRIGGLRVQSFSDFETVHLIDMMQAILDMSAKGLTSQAYTKVPNFAWAFGDTGIKINLSLIGKAQNGRLVFDSKEGMDINDAMKLRERYSDNVGTILVGANDESILLAMADDRIDFIIPFHRSGWSQSQFEDLGLSGYDDYQAYQNERNIDGSAISEGNLYPIDYWDYSKTGKENAERYLEICKEQGRIPKFERFLVDNGDGSWSLQPDGSTDGYWKMLIDFKMYNNQGIGAPQRAVTPTFNMEECERILNEYDGEGNRSLPVDEEAAQKFVEEYKAQHQFSLEPVDPVEPSDNSWNPGPSYAEIKSRFPGLWDTESDDSDTKNPTSVKVTEKSYRKYFEYLKNEGFTGRILDASSGLGYGTEMGRNEYGFDIEDIEPYPSPDGHQPSLGKDYSAVHETFDVILSNAVLNVMPQDQRDALVVKMGEMLNPGGRMIINVRTPADIRAAKSKVEIPGDTTAWYISSTGSYQKGFSYDELKAYLEDALGAGYAVERTSFGGGVTVMVRKSGENSSSRFSRDTDYMEAVNSGDMETAQRMVDEAAKDAGYTIKAYHGTPNGTFNVFNDWSYFTENKDYADIYQNQGASSNRYKQTADNPRTYSVYLDPKEVFDTRNPRDREIFQNEFYMQWGNGTPLSERGLPDWTDGDDLIEFFEENGYDYNAFYLDEGGTGGYGEETKDRGISIIVKDSAQIKSADPVTYDDNGNVIPLSERFNAENNDIRYSRELKSEEKRASGAKLTENQFYSLYSAHKLDLRRQGNVEDQIQAIRENGFKGTGGFSGNTMPTNLSYKTENGKRIPANASVSRYAPRKGDRILLIPRKGLDSQYNVKLGYKPEFDYEIVTADYDYQPYYEMYSKAYDAANGNTARFSRDTTDMESELQKQNRELNNELKEVTERYHYFKDQLVLTKVRQATEKSVNRVAKQLVKDYSSNVSVDEIAKGLREASFLYFMRVKDNADINYIQDELKYRLRPYAMQMVTNASELINAEDVETQKSIRNDLRNGAGIIVTEQMKKDIPNWASFRKEQFGNMKLVSGPKTNIHDVYLELSQKYGEGYFPADVTNESDMLQVIADVMADLSAIYDNPYTYGGANIAEAIESCTNDMMMSVVGSLEAEQPTFADKEKAKRDKLRKEAIEAKNAALQRVREQRDDALAKQSARYKDRVKSIYDKRQQYELRGKIRKKVKGLSDKLLKPTDEKHIPYELQGAVIDVLRQINTGSRFDLAADGSRVELGTGIATKKTNAFIELEKRLTELSKELILDENLLDSKENGTIGYLTELAGLPEISIDSMDTEQLQSVLAVVNACEAAIRTWNKTVSDAKWAEISEAGEALYTENANKNPRDEYREGIERTINLLTVDNLTPEAYFSRMGNAGKALFKMLRAAQDDNIRILKEAQEFSEENGLYNLKLKDYEQKTVTVRFGNRDVEMSKAQLMELYILNKREASRAHIEIGGILPEAVQKKFDIKKVTYAEPIRNITQEDIAKAMTQLSPEDIKIADAMQEFISTVMTKHGNDASMKVYGYKKFGDENYWPIRVNSQDLRTELGEVKTRARSVSNKGFTKPIKPNANQSVAIGSIFDTFTEHVAEMANYASHLAVEKDINRIYNFTERDAKGAIEVSTKYVMRNVYGPQGTAYFEKLMQDLANGMVSEQSYFGGLVGKFKAAAVGSNLRVILQQPTAIFRAMDMISPRYLAQGLLHAKSGMRKAIKNSPIAQWKDWGYFDINTGRSTKNILFQNSSGLDRVQNALMSGAGLADSVSWGALYSAVEAEIKDTRPDLDARSKEFDKVVADRFADIIDHSQVVDGVLQRSALMRSQNWIDKFATAFMAEPTKQYNMMLTAIYDLQHSGPENKAKATKVLARTTAALLFAGVLNAAVQSIVDAIRDDDPEEKYWEKFLMKFTGEEDTVVEFMKSNLGDFLNPAQYVPYAKDIVSLFQGFDVERTDLSLFKDLIDDGRKVLNSFDGKGKYSTTNNLINFMNTASKFLGMSIGNVKRDVAGIANTIAQGTGSYVFEYRMAKFTYNLNQATNKGRFVEVLAKAYEAGDQEAFDIIMNDLIKEDKFATTTMTTEEWIKKRLKDKHQIIIK